MGKMTTKLNMMSRIFILWVTVAWSISATAEVFTTTASDDLQGAINNLQAGDELWLEGGTYTLNSGLKIDLVSQIENPTIIRAKDDEVVLIDLPSASYNLIEIRNSQNLILKGIAFRGGSHGIRLIASDFITIEDCEVYETGDVAISANSGGTYEGLIIRRNHIHHTNGTGEGMYLGCNNDACRVANSLISGNYVHHTNRSSVVQGDGIELKEGSFGNVIKDNVIHDTNYPGILTYSTVGNGPPNVIEGNLIWNTNDYAIQSAADSIIRNNIILGGTIGLQSHQAGSPSNIEIAHNTIVADGTGIVIRSITGPVLVVNNAVYSQSGTAIRLVSGDTSQVIVEGNVGTGGISGTAGGIAEGQSVTADFVDAQYGQTPPIDVFPSPGSALIGTGSATYVTQIDFNGTPRSGVADAGAYRFDSSGNPGWALAPGFKGRGGGPTVPRAPTDLQTN